MADTYDVRPGEACIVNLTDHPQVVTTRLFLDPRGRPFPLGLEPNLVYIVAAVFGGREAALEIDRDNRPRVQLEETATRGAIPVVLSATSAAEVARWLGRGSPPSFAERVEEASKRYELPDRSVAEAVCRLVDAGFGEGEAAHLALDTHALELARHGLYRFSWSAWTDTLIAARVEAAARIGGGRM